MYSLNRLETTIDCNVLLDWAQRERADLILRKVTDERLAQKYSNTSDEINTARQEILAEISAMEILINVLPEGATKEAEIKRKIRLEYKKFVSENRRDSLGSVTLLEKELDLGRVKKELIEINAFITAVTAHKATLPSS